MTERLDRGWGHVDRIVIFNDVRNRIGLLLVLLFRRNQLRMVDSLFG